MVTSRSDRIPVVLITSDPAWENSIREFLTSSGRVHLVRVFQNPEQALHLLPHIRPVPEIILLTENAGGVSELSTCRLISQAMPQSSVILIVGEAQFEDPRYLRSAMAHGADDVLRMTLPPRFQGWMESIERVWDLLRGRQLVARRETGQIVAIFSLKGGVGKTTLAIGLADRLSAASSSPAIYVDLNWHAGMTEALVGLPTPRSWLESLEFQQWSPAILDSLVTRSRDALRFEILAAPREEDHLGLLQDLFLPSRIALEEGTELERLYKLMSDPARLLEDDLFRDLIRRSMQHVRAEHAIARVVHNLLVNLRAHYRYVVLDLPPAADPLTLLALQRADHVVIVLVPDLAALRAAHLALDLMRRMGVPGEIGVVLNRATRRSEIRPDSLQRLLKGMSWIAAIPEESWMAADRTPADVLRRPGMLKAIERLAANIIPASESGGRPAPRSEQG